MSEWADVKVVRLLITPLPYIKITPWKIINHFIKEPKSTQSRSHKTPEKSISVYCSQFCHWRAIQSSQPRLCVWRDKRCRIGWYWESLESLLLLGRLYSEIGYCLPLILRKAGKGKLSDSKNIVSEKLPAARVQRKWPFCHLCCQPALCIGLQTMNCTAGTRQYSQ